MSKTEKVTISAADVGSVDAAVLAAPKTPKLYMVRHQRAGIVTSHVFLSPPTEAQIAPIKAECERLHGKEGWAIIHEAELMDGSAIPIFPERSASGGTDNIAAVSGPVISGTGTVTPRNG